MASGLILETERFDKDFLGFVTALDTDGRV
jgi:hypothetical protein